MNNGILNDVEVLLEQKKWLNIIDDYNNSDPKLIRANINMFTRNIKLKSTLQDVAEAIGISIHTLRKWRQANWPSKPRFEDALKLATVLEIGVLDLMSEDNERFYSEVIDVVYECNAFENPKTTLDRCEKECARYYGCDKVALMQDNLKHVNGEL